MVLGFSRTLKWPLKHQIKSLLGLAGVSLLDEAVASLFKKAPWGETFLFLPSV